MNSLKDEIAAMRGLGYEDIVIHATPLAGKELARTDEFAQYSNVRTVRYTFMGCPLWLTATQAMSGFKIVVEARDVAKFPVKRRGLTKDGWKDMDDGASV